ncbi:MAG: DHH family phosphoesterase, partial [Saprospiraceae bacterium]|nr:DHH family phosphoesterase [Saprospiraceae bacterium]
MENAHQLKSIIDTPKDVLIVTHRNPDGDAIGSTLGLYHYLRKYGHHIKLVSPSEYPEFLDWME